MAVPLQIQVFDRQQRVCVETFTGPIVLGRQRDGREVIYSSRREGEQSRLAIARLDEDTVSRDHARIEPAAGGQIKVTNLSAKVSIRLADGSELRAGTSSELGLPVVLALGRKTVRVSVPDSREASLRSLPAAPPPAAPSILVQTTGRFPSVAIQSLLASPGAQQDNGIEEIVRWLQTTMEVLQLAASSDDFFPRAAQAIVDIVGLDRGRVLLLQNGDWKPVATHAPTQTGGDEWRPSHQVLSRILSEKRTYWTAPDVASLDTSGTLAGVEVVIASPILSPEGTVIGALYGDTRQDSIGAGTTKVTRLEALLVEVIARSVAVGLARMEQERAAVAARVQFEQFFTRELSQQLASEPNLLEGRDCEVTLLFTDIRGFSRISEKLGPEGTVKWISHMMAALSDCVLKHQGVLVDYIGDELLAMWGAPVPQPQHARMACLAALDMLDALPALNEQWEATTGEPVNIGIGVNTGVARVGNTGSKYKFKYGPLGNTVNLASRVQGATKYLKCPLLVTQSTQACLDNTFNTRKLCEVRVMNIKMPVALYELVQANQPRWADLKAKYEAGLVEFNERRFRPAARILGNLLGEVPDDGPALVLMARAVNALVDAPDEMHPVWNLPGK